MVLFLGSDTDLATSEWSKEDPACYVGRLEPYEEPVRKHFSKKHVRYLGSHLHCGCGFGFEYDNTDGEEPENAASRTWLVSLLRQLVDAEGEVEVYSCWSGDEADEIVERVRVVPEDLADVAALGEGTFALVSNRAV
jgi:hypothetical protein